MVIVIVVSKQKLVRERGNSSFLLHPDIDTDNEATSVNITNDFKYFLSLSFFINLSPIHYSFIHLI